MEIFMLKDHGAHLISLIRRAEKYPRLWNELSPLLHYLSTQKFITALTGPRFERSRSSIDIDITYACNLKCFNCSRSCGLAPSDDRLSLEQIQKFLRETLAKGIQWEKINILGGEPTLHPEFLPILDALIAFRDSHRPAAEIAIYTNGSGKKVNDVLKKLNRKVVVFNTAKKSNAHVFFPFNLAPKDFVRYRYVDYSSGCWLLHDCGMGLSPYGYYPCALSAAIDRVLGFDIGRKSLPELSDDMRDQMEALCRYCGLFTNNKLIFINKNLMSKSWRQAYENYQVSKPHMTFY
jgi:hypothetical protein